MNKKIILSLMVFLFLMGRDLYSQSDYQTVQNFKNRVAEIEQSIRGADSLEVLDEIREDINSLRSEYSDNKALLDKSLYPDNFDKTIERLRAMNNLRKGDFTQITVLEVQVTDLRVQVDTLNRRNDELANQFALLESQNREDKTRILQLERMVSQLRISLQKRDQIVMNMIDSLLPPSVRDGDALSSEQKQEIISEAERNNVLAHIRRAVNDNIRLLRDTELKPEDIGEIKTQQNKFMQIWRSVGPTMIDIYSQGGKSTGDLVQIDEAFVNWDNEINREVWESVNKKFAENNINLRAFSNGREFTETVTSYIEDKIKRDEGGGDEAEADYKRFVDSTWYDEIKPQWVPFLVSNDMLSQSQVDTIETQMASWEEAVSPGGGFNLLYIVIGVLVIIIIVLLFTRRTPRRVEEEPVIRE